MRRYVVPQVYQKTQTKDVQVSRVKLPENQKHAMVVQMRRSVVLQKSQKMPMKTALDSKVKKQENQKRVRDAQTKTFVQVVKQKRRTQILMRLKSDLLKSKILC